MHMVLVQNLKILRRPQRMGGTLTTPGPDLGGLSEGDLLDLTVPSESLNRRVLVMWLYLREGSQMGLEQFDAVVTSLAEKEMRKRAVSESAKE